MKFFMHRDLQNAVCFNFGRRAEDADSTRDYITLHDIVLALVLLVDAWALDLAAHQLAVNFLVKR